ncbi:MAG TPA: hypothetical protein VHG10_03775 [Glycomyces sp.]|nr:hypothetical protein [Glycomyces sp.]
MRNQARAMVLVQDPFYRHDSLGPGAPLREITGASEQAGFYDWAGRRLFMADGEPDPMCAGAYRYQHNPDCCDTEAPDSDPRSPRYEPMHLRHKPGDTWIIDTNRPYDPYDPGPYGTHGWYQDERTGRHRRDELPDPLPSEGWVPPGNAWFPGTAVWPEPPALQADSAGWADQTGQDGSDRPLPWAGRFRPVPSDVGDRLSAEGRGTRPRPPWGPREAEGGQSVSYEQDSNDRSSSGPRSGSGPRPPWERRDLEAARPQHDHDSDHDFDDREPGGHRAARRPWGRDEPGGDRGEIRRGGASNTGETGDRESDRGTGSSGGEYRFSKLREDAFDRFMVQSAQLRAAHFQPERPYARERAFWMLRWLLWVFACGLAPMPTPLTAPVPQAAPLTVRERRPGPAAPQALPATPATRGRPPAPAPDRRETGTAPETALATPPAPQPIPAQPGPDVPAGDGQPTSAPRPGEAIAAAVDGARAARKAIADRRDRTSTDLAAAVRDTATRWRIRPRQDRPRPAPSTRISAQHSTRPASRPAPGSYMAAWEQAFDTGTFILGTGREFGAAA